jgi:glycosyltransferase involved in cell wall biosynthesis
VSSMLAQTFREFELLIIDDGSTDRTAQMLQTYNDPRIRIITNQSNLGLIESLNMGLAEARGRCIARMDADDISLPNRLERQLAFLHRYPTVGICGTWFRVFGGRRKFIVRPPSRPDDVAAHLFFYSPIAHPTVMLRKEVIDRFSLRYDRAALHAEDYDLWIRASDHVLIANVPEVLLLYRNHGQQVSTISDAVQMDTARRIRLRQLRRLCPSLVGDEEEFHLDLCEYRCPVGKHGILRAREWLERLDRANREKRLYPLAAFRDALSHVWFTLCVHEAATAGVRLLPAYLGRAYSNWSLGAFRQHAHVTARALRHSLGFKTS